jgi:hypothetical protein
MHALHAMLREELEFVRTRMKKFYNRERLEGPRLERGDMVYLTSRNIKTKRPSKKLDFKKLGPFKIEDKVGTVNFRLRLPATMRLRTNVFHISLLEPAPQTAKPQDDIEAEDEEEEWDVEQVLDSRITEDSKLEYLIKWLDFGPEDNSWEPATNLHCPEKLEEFHRRNPDRPKAPPVRKEKHQRQGMDRPGRPNQPPTNPTPEKTSRRARGRPRTAHR